MISSPFYGRQRELNRLKSLLKKSTSSLIVIKGRRRIGKSRLIAEFSKDLPTFFFIGLPPDEKTTAQSQRDVFVKQMHLLGMSKPNADDWTDIFWQLAQEANKGRVVIVFDEINWMGSLDHEFLGKLKSAWDLHFKNNPQLLLILSGSMSGWINDNILNSTGFLGRVSLELTLQELPLHVCNLFWQKQALSVSSYEKFKILSITGGVPRYLEEINPALSAEENIYNLAYQSGGLLVQEFERIFSDLFLKRSGRYKSIIERLVEGSATLEQIASAIEREKSGVLSGYMQDLVQIGYVAEDKSWNFKTGKQSTIVKFRLKDNYLRFFLKYIEPNLMLIQNDLIKTPPAWTTIMGLQFENLVINNLHQLIALLHINSHDIVNANPYYQRPTSDKRGCQIDYLIQDKFNTLYAFEIKFSNRPLGASVVNEMKDKIKYLARPKHFSVRPILVHVNGVTDAVIESGFFANILDFGQFLVTNQL